jgi:hypothetical protein
MTLRGKQASIILWLLIGSTILSSIFSIIMMTGLNSINKKL